MFYVIEHRTNQRGGVELPKKVAVDEATERAMKQLGELITECRGTRSLRKIAKPSGIPASQLQYLEKGIMAPTADVYPKLLNVLNPSEKQRTKMDHLYMAIRKTPPPDICDLIINNQNLIPVLRAMEGAVLTSEKMKALLTAIAQENRKGDTDNG